MALHYNLSKVYQLSDNDSEFVNKEVFAYAHKIKPTLDLLGMHVAFEEMVLIEAWAKAEGNTKNIKETYKSVKSQVKDAIKEIKKDFNL